MRLPITLTLFLVATAFLRAEAPSLEGSMPEDYLPGLRPLLKEAVDRSPTTIAASISVAQAEAARYSNASALWPSISGGSSYQENTESVTKSDPQSSHGFYYNAGITQPLFQWGALKNQAEIGNLGMKIAERQFAETYRSLAIVIREQYLALIGKKIQLRNSQFNLKLSDEALQAEQARFDSGAASQADLGNFRMAKEQVQLDTDRAADDFGYAKRVFTRLIGIDDLSDDEIPSDIPHPEFSSPKADAVLAGFVADGAESTFQSQVYKMSIRQGDLNYSIAKVRLLPRFSAAAGISFSNQTSIAGNDITQQGVLAENYQVAASWTIFDGFATKAAKLSARATIHLYEHQEKAYVDSMIDQITFMRHQLGFTARSLAIAETHYNLIDAEVKRIGQDKTLGYASQASVDAGLLTLYATGFQQAYARTDYLSRWTEFVSLAGVDPALSNLSPRYVR